MKTIIFKTLSQKILNYLIKYPGRQFTAVEIQEALSSSKGGTNAALRELARAELVNREERASIFLYSINDLDPTVRQLRVLNNIIELRPLLNRVNKLSLKVILFGSSARGEDAAESDIDLFILTNFPQKIRRFLGQEVIGRKLQLIAKTPVELAEMETRDRVFFEEIIGGIVLWEARDDRRI